MLQDHLSTTPDNSVVTEDSDDRYTDYEDVPWYRRSGVNSVLVALGLLFAPATGVVCWNLVTGDIYYRKRRPDGTLKTWSYANKVVAFLMLAAELVVFVIRVYRRLAG